jgi:REP element-mobilizing transposase RayT
MAPAREARHSTPALPFPERGGTRRGAGRKPSSLRARVSHSEREHCRRYHPQLVTLRLRDDCPSLRVKWMRGPLHRAFRDASERFGFRLVHFSIQTNHIHFLVEVESSLALARGMQGLTIRVARTLNRLWKRKGKVFADHYHAHPVTSPRGAHHSLRYVLNNALKHGIALEGTDPFSSAAWFDGWTHVPGSSASWFGAPVVRPRTWLLTEGWRRHGLIDPRDVPGSAVPRKRRAKPN